MTSTADSKAAENAPAWKSFSAEKLAAIDKVRKEAESKGPLVMDPKGTYGIICPACLKVCFALLADCRLLCAECICAAARFDSRRFLHGLLLPGDEVGHPAPARQHFPGNDQRQARSLQFPFANAAQFIAAGKDVGAKVVYRDDEILVFDDKFGARFFL